MGAALADQTIALTRFGYGGKRGQSPPAEPREWLLDQINRYDPRPQVLSSLGDTPAGLAAFKDYRIRRAETRDENSTNNQRSARDVLRKMLARSTNARLSLAATTDTPFTERLVHFWTNHFAVSTDKLRIAPLAGPFEAEAIRPNLMGRFEDLVLAVERHPAMLLYLDQAGSVGPNSPLGSRITARGKRKAGLNENLAREILELHTLGVRAGYSQSDVTEFAGALTGWTFESGDRTPGGTGRFVFLDRAHEPGVRTILGKRYSDRGEGQARAVLEDLAAHPATARHVATKLARHFVADTPPEALVRRLEATLLETDGDLPSLYRALLNSAEAWQAERSKFLTPFEWLIATQRATGQDAGRNGGASRLLVQLGQPLWRPGSPAGYTDVADSWAAPDALFRRVELAAQLATRAGNFDARAEAARLYPGVLGDATRSALTRAESSGQATVLLLTSPEAMWR